MTPDEPESLLLAMIRDTSRVGPFSLVTRRDVAYVYAVGIATCPRSLNWRRVNRAILRRWSVSGLNWIKREAWKRARGRGDLA